MMTDNPLDTWFRVLDLHMEREGSMVLTCESCGATMEVVAPDGLALYRAASEKGWEILIQTDPTKSPVIATCGHELCQAAWKDWLERN